MRNLILCVIGKPQSSCYQMGWLTVFVITIDLLMNIGSYYDDIMCS
jgi:hypothetical protein